MSSDFKIDVRPSVSSEWPWTAYLLRWDGDEWRTEAAEDGDTRDEAVTELQAQSHDARRCGEVAAHGPTD
jgi:hypothetical protein